MTMFVTGLLLIGVAIAALWHAIPRRQAGGTATGSARLDGMLPVTIVSFVTIGIAMVLSALTA